MKILRAPFIVSVASLGVGLVGCGNGGAVRTQNPPGPAPEECPLTAPSRDTACGQEGLDCHYGSTDPCEQSYMDYRCVGGVLRPQGPPTCNPPEPPPPEPTACPASPPGEGAPCQGDLDCRYGGDSCSASYAHYRCDGGAMRLMPRPTCNPPEPTMPVAPSSKG